MVRNSVPWSTKSETEDMIRWFDYLVPSHWLSADLLKIRLVSYSRSSSGSSGLTVQPLAQSTSEQQWKWWAVVQPPTVYHKKYTAPEPSERAAAVATALLAANVNINPKPGVSVALGSLFGLSCVPWWLCCWCLHDCGKMAVCVLNSLESFFFVFFLGLYSLFSPSVKA